MYMNRLPEVLVSGFFAILASVVLLYITISSGIGPWIAPVIVLAAAALGKFCGWYRDNPAQRLALIQAAGAHVGLTAVAVGFSVPTYFFIDKQAFMSLVLDKPVVLCAGLAGFLALWSLIGTLLGQVYADHLLLDSSLKIPVADVIKTTINVSGERQEFLKLVQGAGIGGLLCAVRDAFRSHIISGFMVARSIPALISAEAIVASVIAPTFWAVGFIAGPAMGIALFIGVASKYALLQPIYSSINAFRGDSVLSFEQYLVAVSSGLVLADLCAGLASMIFKGCATAKDQEFFMAISDAFHEFWSGARQVLRNLQFEFFALSCVAGLAFFKFVGISSPLLVGFLVLAIGMSVYQMTLVSGQIGFVQFGRFATFVMLPCLVFFGVTSLQAVIISAIVCVVGASTANLLFQYRLADELSIPRTKMYRIQLLSSVFGAVSIAVVFWLLCSHLQLGTTEFFAFRCYSRALLIQSFSFDVVSLAVGVIFGLVLRYFGASPAMVLGGLLMPAELVVAFVMGAGFGYLVESPKKHMATASGIFAAEAVWIFLRIIYKLVWA